VVAVGGLENGRQILAKRLTGVELTLDAELASDPGAGLERDAIDPGVVDAARIELRVDREIADLS
jgi:hypothetical protein